jgi:ligand-binding sensor domain-containing protein
MKRLLLFSMACFALHALHAQTLPSIGQWRDHLPMRSIVNLDNSSSKLIAATSFGYFTYNPAAKSYDVHTKARGLSEVNLKHLAKDPFSEKMLIVYENANIDLVEGDQIRNIPDVLLSKIQGDKTINHILWAGTDALLSSNLGIIAVNTQRKEIRDTYRPGNNGADIKIFQLALMNNLLYAASSEGLKKASFQTATLGDFRSWTLEPIPGVAGIVDNILNWNDRLVARKRDSIFVKSNGSWSLFYVSSRPITAINTSGNGLYIGQSLQGKGAVVYFADPGAQAQLIATPSMSFPVETLKINQELWIGDINNGLIKVSATADEQFLPNAPYGIAYGGGTYANATVWAAAGTVGADGKGKLNKMGFFGFKDDQWQNFNSRSMPALDSMPDITVLAVDPSKQSVLAGSFGGGLLEISKDVKPMVFKQGSFLSPAMTDPSSFRVAGLAFDLDLNLWMANHGAQQDLVVRKKDGSTKKFTIPFPHAGNAVAAITIDDQNRKWIISPQGNGLFCFDDGGTIDQTSDDKWRYFRQGRGSGNLPSSNVLSVESDRNGFVWVGTDRGIAIIQCGDDLFNNTLCDATLPVVQQDNFAGLLLAEETVNDIKVDGANRKWVASKNGVWLLSADGQKTIHRFTVSNSSLLSNEVFSIVIHQRTGEVFFFTANGICSYRGTATAAATEKKKPFVFPNPVPPGFTGTIAIRDLPDNAWVRITELDGRLVHQSRSLGGQAIWNGKNYKGERVNSGVYLVYVADENNQQQVAAKIFFIQ